MEDLQKMRKLMIERFFEKEPIANLYQKVRESTIVETYYQNMIKGIKQLNKDYSVIQEILDDEEIAVDNERTIKEQLFDLALNQMLSEGNNNLDTAVISVLTEQNVLRAIDDLEEILEETAREFCKKTIEDIIFKVGLKYTE